MHETATILKQAIENRFVVEFEYGGHRRTVEPHVLGVLHGKLELVAFQTGGTSESGGLPEWRRFVVDKISVARFTLLGFLPRQERTPPLFDTVLAS